MPDVVDEVLHHEERETGYKRISSLELATDGSYVRYWMGGAYIIHYKVI